jgi:predicted nucleic acid-binding protein
MSICSLDTNILLYAANEDAPEHEVCKDLLRQIIEVPAEWVIADQVYLELYRALRNPRVMSNPLSAKPAAKHTATLLSYGVKIFYTRNTKDFEASGFESVINPVDK